MNYTNRAIIFVLGCIAIGSTIFLAARAAQERSRADAAEERIGTYCNLVRSMLDMDAHSLRDTASLQHPAIKARVGRSGELDGSAALETCLPASAPFPNEAWDGCVASGDHECLIRILKAMSKSIPRYTSP